MEQFCLNPRRKLSPVYASAELLWYLSRTFSGEMIKAYAPKYEAYLDSWDNAYGAYGGRWAHNLELTTEYRLNQDLLEETIKLLSVHPSTKKAVIAIWRPDDLLRTGHTEDYAKQNDLPCTLNWQFLVRGEQLHMFCYMRSCDLWKGCLFDCYVNTVIQRYVAWRLGLTAGEYHHIVGSMHLYERNAKAAAEVSEHETEAFHPVVSWTESELDCCLKIEEEIRRDRTRVWIASDGFFSTTLNDALICCTEQGLDKLRSPGLRKGYEQFRGIEGVRSASA